MKGILVSLWAICGKGRRPAALAGLLLIFGAGSAVAQSTPIDAVLAQRYFEETRQFSAADHGRLWGVELCGPMIFVDAESRAVAANQADADGRLAREGALYAGKLPPREGAANRAIEWAGVRWTMILWPLPEYRRDREALMMHECFHRVQDSLGLTMRDAINSQLDTRDGRIWLQLEWRALERALEETGQARRTALADALLFRGYRRSLFPGAAEKENALEMNEGLAEYTGQKLANPSPGVLRVSATILLRRGHFRPTFVRSFAYVSGPAYGTLLDEAPQGGMAWRKGLKPDSDFGMLAARAYGIPQTKPSEAEALARGRAYDGDEIIAIETEREASHKAVLAAARARFVDGPVLVLPAWKDVNYSFDPNGVAAIDENRSVYTPMRVSDAWGVLDCAKGALLVRENGNIVRVQVPAPVDPAARPVVLDGCTLDLQPGWGIVPGSRRGDAILKLKP
jgi:hypothetical protein